MKDATACRKMDPCAVATINMRLDDICRAEPAAIPLAIESGSRAWGFPSPDSDYDCRFVFVRPLEQYLSPWQRRDVIETPLEGEFDINGWEIGKALKLLLKGNAVIIEWLMSPIAYRSDEQFRDGFLKLAQSITNRRLIGRHYLHLGERQRRTYFGDGKDVPQKKIFYALRPAAALRWLRLHPTETVAPMHFPTLLEESEPSSDVTEIVRNLLARKAETRELGSQPLAAALARFIDSEFELARENFDGPAPPASAEAVHLAEKFFRSTVCRLDSRAD